MSKERAHPRVELTIRVNCVLEDTFFTDFSRNVSEGGMCLESLVPIREGTDIRLQFALPGAKNQVYSLNGQVVWVDQQRAEPSGSAMRPIGIRFQPDDHHGRFRVDFVQSYLETGKPTDR